MIALLTTLLLSAGPRPWLPGDSCVVSRPLKIEAPGKPKPLAKGTTVVVVSVDRLGVVVKAGDLTGKVKLSTLARQCNRPKAPPAALVRKVAPTPPREHSWGSDLPPLPASPGDLPPLPADGTTSTPGAATAGLPPMPEQPDDMPPLVAPTEAKGAEVAGLPPLLPPPPDEAPGATPRHEAWTDVPLVASSSDTSPRGDHRLLALSLAGGGGVALGGAAVAYVLASQLTTDLERDIKSFNDAVAAGTATKAADTSIKDRRRKLATYDLVTLGAGVVGLAALGASATLWLLAPSAQARTSVTVGAAPSTGGGALVLVSGAF